MPGLHHVELWVADYARESPAWEWLLTRIGIQKSAEWPAGSSWSLGSSYLTISTPPTIVDLPHDRRRPGINHLAFTIDARHDLDALIAAAPAQGWTPLYADRYPYAGGPDHYAGWLENTNGFKVEVVAGR